MPPANARPSSLSLGIRKQEKPHHTKAAQVQDRHGAAAAAAFRELPSVQEQCCQQRLAAKECPGHPLAVEYSIMEAAHMHATSR
jgi:hypothetical protein